MKGSDPVVLFNETSCYAAKCALCAHWGPMCFFPLTFTSFILIKIFSTLFGEWVNGNVSLSSPHRPANKYTHTHPYSKCVILIFYAVATLPICKRIYMKIYVFTEFFFGLPFLLVLLFWILFLGFFFAFLVSTLSLFIQFQFFPLFPLFCFFHLVFNLVSSFPAGISVPWWN